MSWIIGPPFTPQNLFRNGEQGVWYDPSDSSTLFTDRAGTTPCAIPGAGTGPIPVGLMLDKSQGLMVGPELVTNGDFSNGTTGWTAQNGATLSVVGGELVVTGNGIQQYPGAQQNVPTVAGRWYRLTAKKITKTSGGGYAAVQLSNTYENAGSLFMAVGSSTSIRAFLSNADGIGQFDNISVRELAGNHAIAANDTTARPELSARVNLLTYSEQFDNGAWIKDGVTITANSIIAPDGTLTADQFTASSSVIAYAYQNITMPSCIATFSAYVKAGNNSVFWLYYNTGAGYGAACFDIDLTTQIVSGSSGSPSNLTINSVGNGWFKISAQWTVLAGSAYVGIGISNTKGSFSTSIGKTGYIWGLDFRPSNTGFLIPSYQRVVDQYTYDNVGFPRYLKFDGLNTAMVTPSNINLSSSTQATIFAGIRNNTDAARAIVLEFGPTLANTGTFYLAAPDTVSNYKFGVGLNGNATGSRVVTTSTYNAPVTSVISAEVNTVPTAVSDEIKIRVNRTVPLIEDGVSSGSGNLGNYPLYIGARNTSSLYFNGNIYGIIVRGSTLTFSQIYSAENWLNDKTRAY